MNERAEIPLMPIKMSYRKRTDHTKFGQGCGELGFAHITGENVKWYKTNHFVGLFGSFL